MRGLLMQAQCPICDGTVVSDDYWEIGELVDCPDCSAMLEVTSLDPLTLEEAPEEDEDWGE